MIIIVAARLLRGKTLTPSFAVHALFDVVVFRWGKFKFVKPAFNNVSASAKDFISKVCAYTATNDDLLPCSVSACAQLSSVCFHLNTRAHY
jgi:hypothetical protein